MAMQGILRNGAGEAALAKAVVEKLVMAWGMKERMAQIEREIEKINAEIARDFSPGDVLIVPGLCRATVAKRQTVKIDDPARLEAVLGGRYLDLVREETAYKAEGKLVEMAADADEPLAPSIRACLSIRESVTVTWRADGEQAAEAKGGGKKRKEVA